MIGRLISKRKKKRIVKFFNQNAKFAIYRIFFIWGLFYPIGLSDQYDLEITATKRYKGFRYMNIF